MITLGDGGGINVGGVTIGGGKSGGSGLSLGMPDFGSSLRTGADMFFGTNFTGVQAQIDMAREANRITQEENQKNRDFQERMSSSAYQRAMKDMSAAGLNPMLAFSQGGASTPGGSAGSGQTAGQLDPASQASLKALAIKKQKQEIENISATAKNIKANTKKIKSETKAINYQMPKNKAIGEGGRLLTQGLETIQNSAKSTAKNVTDKLYNSLNNTAKRQMIKEENAYIKYQKSQAAKDARSARKRKKTRRNKK